MATAVFDYLTNKREVEVEIFEVKGHDMQEKFTFDGEITKKGNLNYISGNILEPLDIREGAQADVYIDEKYFEGYLQNLTKTTDTLYTADVSVVSEEDLSGKATVTVYGGINENVMIVPEECIFTDEKGNECVMVITQGYSVKRNIEVGKIKTNSGRQIKKGVFCEEEIILNPKGIKTGDKVRQIR